MTFSLYPFVAVAGGVALVQTSPMTCPAPWCLRPFDRMPWFTMVMEPGALARPLLSLTVVTPLPKGYRLATCHAPACRAWAELRAIDIAEGDGLLLAEDWRFSDYYRGYLGKVPR